MQTIILGFDAFDPQFFENMIDRGMLPNLARYVDRQGYSRFEVASPPQSEVSWTSIATGLDPGGHGIFDFVHRDPKTYTYFVSLLPTQTKLGGVQFIPPFTSRTIFEHSTILGYPATSLWWPASFPARLELATNSLPGLGTPDIQGKLGAGTFLTSEQDFVADEWKTKIDYLTKTGKDRYTGMIKGPQTGSKGNNKTAATISFSLECGDDNTVKISFDQKQSSPLELSLGKWSPILELTFKIGLFVKVRAITRLIVTNLKPYVNLYCLPLQIHPLHSPWQYSAPPAFAKNTWNQCGPFLTLGWPQDTTGLEDGCITDEQFLDLCKTIFEKREEIFFHYSSHFREGILASVFDSLDRIQHMFWRDRPDIIEDWYQRLDNLVGRVEQEIETNKTRLLIVSDHGFTRFDHKIHLNRWLINQGYLIPQKTISDEKGTFRDIDWTRSQAYALGLNSLYMNLSGREGQGNIQKEDIEVFLSKLRTDLLSWKGPDGTPVLRTVYYRNEVFSGALVQYGPDLILGYAPGYRASGETGIGSWGNAATEPNQDHWGADHCIDSKSVPGVLFSNQGLKDFPSPSYRDFPMIAINATIEDSGKPAKPAMSDEDQKTLEERLEGLGYL